MNIDTNARLAAIAVCPSCGGALRFEQSRAISLGCGKIFPLVDGMPWLFPDPDAMLAQWRSRLTMLLQHLEGESASLDGELKRLSATGKLASLTRQRLTRLRDAKKQHRQRLKTLLEPLGVTVQGSLDLSRALRHRLPVTQSLTGYYVNMHRDWVWGDEENAAALASVTALLEDRPSLGRVLVLGAGSCRLAYDVHRHLQADCTVALDFNPLMMIVAQRVIKGETVKLYEFPIAPKDLDSVAVERELRVPDAAAARGLSLLFGDALAAPFAPGSFDTVLTPWLVDIIPASLDRTAAEVNRLLAPGGRWLEFGSLAFAHREQALNFSWEEARQQLQDSGFQLLVQENRQLPYMASPASLHARRETAVCFSAEKIAETPRLSVPPALPEWLLDKSRPIPRLRDFDTIQTMHQVYFDVISAIDGQRSLADIAVAFAAKYGMRPEEAVASLHGFLLKIVDELSARGS